jgi:hypothetical protein
MGKYLSDKSEKGKIITENRDRKRERLHSVLVSYQDSDGRTQHCYSDQSEEVLLEWGFKEVIGHEGYADEYTDSITLIKQNTRKTKGVRFEKFSNQFKKRLELVSTEGERRALLIKGGAISPTDTISEQKNYTFGVEIETSVGLIPTYKRADLNIKSEFDGSIYGDNKKKAFGGEYVTGVLRGDTGFSHLNKILNELNKYCGINNTCSVHVHVGNLTFNKDNTVFLWKVLKDLEEEIFSTVPASRRNNPYCGRIDSGKLTVDVDEYDYYNSIDESYRNIVKIVSLGNEPSQKVNKANGHPAGRSCGYNKKTPRYWWINFVPTLFSISGIEGHTTEIRIHAATLNFIKIRNLILMFMGIVSFVENHKRTIMEGNYNLHSVMRATYPRRGDYLVEYLKRRTEQFSKGLSGEKMEYKDRSVIEGTKLKELF